MHPDDLETRVGRSLARLPAPRAPRTLLPRVLAAVRRPARRSRRSRAGRAAALLLLVLLASAGAALLRPGGVADLAARAASDVAVLAADAAELERAARVLWRVFLEPGVRYVVAFIGVMCAAGAMFFVALTRVLREGSVTR